MFNLRDLLNIYERADMYQFVLQDGQGIMVLGVSSIGDIPAELWYFDTNSTATDNGTTVIHPNAVPSGVAGRYLKMEIQADWNALNNKPTLGTAALYNVIDFATSAQGTKADNALQPGGNGSALTGITKSQVGLSNVDNTSDASKPVSTAQASAIATKQNLVTLTTTGSGAATFNQSTGALNIPTPTAGKRQETYSGTTNSSGVYTVTYGTAFSAVPNVNPQLGVGATNKETIVMISSTTTGCSFKVETRNDVLGLLPTYSNVNNRTVDVLVTEK